MKIKVTFRKLLEGGVNAFIEVTDAGDLPTANIFKDIKDYPSKKEYHLTDKGSSSINYSASNSKDAEKWAEKQISALHVVLAEWRDISLPEGYEVEIY